ncbi:hypothetical protein D3880_07945 [Pseudomonas cavernae]|uniref:RepB-like DNA primase domain-containing protein n=1 Tax=Pseudomonas cavernae TaxID=2320867 RepID=A0A385Z481_9PSED|nr:AAA family ATPase [Pseudomonas cavernae]AYC32312.1 hypothetical protein D3880_07945 [Pseudomonas cavernae]
MMIKQPWHAAGCSAVPSVNQVTLTEATRFLAALDSTASVWAFQTFDDSPAKRPELAATRHGTLEQCAPWLAKMNARGAGVFVTINETDGQGRKTSNVCRVRALFADFDNPVPGTLERLRTDSLPPSIIVESSAGKLHAYWLVESLPPGDFKARQQSIARHWGSDPKVCDLPRVMRLPGFLHCKGDPQPVRLMEVTGKRYAQELADRYVPAAPNTQERTQAQLAAEAQRYAVAALESACDAVARAKDGTRNDTLNREAFGIAQLVAGGELPEASARDGLLAAAQFAGLGQSEVLRTLESAFDAGTNYPRTVPEPKDAQQEAPPGGTDPRDAKQSARPALVEVPLDDVMSASLEPVRHAIKPWMPRRHVTLFGGHGGVGKSSLALAIGAHVACGLPFADLEVEQSPVLFVSLEDEASIVRLRLRHIIEAYQLPAERVLANMRLLDGTLAFAALMTEGESFSAPAIFTPAFRELTSQSEGAGLIVIDNASDAFDANENSRRTVRAFVRGLAAIARKYDAAVALLAHIDKSAAKDGARGNSYSGSTAWHNSARSRLALLEQDGRILLMHEKANLSARAEPLALTFVDGVPVPESGVQSGGLNSENFDHAEIIRAMKAAHEAGILVPGSLSAGAHSAMKALEPLPEYAKTFRGRIGGQRAARALTALLRNGRIRRIEFKTPHRKTRERLELVELSAEASNPFESALAVRAESAPRHPPYTPQRTGAAPRKACADAPNMTSAAPNVTGAIGAKECVRDLVGATASAPVAAAEQPEDYSDDYF